MKKTLSLADARKAFRLTPNEATAMAYAKATKTKLEQEHISTDRLAQATSASSNVAASVAVELERAGFKLAMLHLMS